MKILFLTLADLSNVDINGIYPDLLRKFRDRGHEVYVACPVERRNGTKTFFYKQSGISILRVKIGNITKVNLLEKGLSTLFVENRFLKEIKRHFSKVKFDLVLYSTPPITFEKVVGFIKNRDDAKSYLLLKDIFPQNAVDLGMFSKKSLFYKYFRNKEKRLYMQSDFIGCMSQANVDFILKQNSYINSQKVEVCPNSINPTPIIIDKERIKSIRKKYEIPNDRIVFVYGGNLGKPQGIDFLINCIKSNKNNQNIFFLIAGSGTEFGKLQSFINNEKVSNVKLFHHLPKEDYELLVNSSDVGLVFLDRRFTIPNFPSRILEYMQASMPILAATDKNTDLGRIIESGHFGYWCESGDINSFNKLLKLLSSEMRMRSILGENGRKYLEENYTVENTYQIIMNHFERKINNV